MLICYSYATLLKTYADIITHDLDFQIYFNVHALVHLIINDD